MRNHGKFHHDMLDCAGYVMTEFKMAVVHYTGFLPSAVFPSALLRTPFFIFLSNLVQLSQTRAEILSLTVFKMASIAMLNFP